MLKSQERFIYLDSAATSCLDPEVKKSIKNQLDHHTIIGNPSSKHQLGISIHHELLNAKKQICGLLGITNFFSEKNCIFTSGATESNNLLIQGYLKTIRKNVSKNDMHMHMIYGPTEHACIRECIKMICEYDDKCLCDEGKLMTDGKLDFEWYEKNMNENTVLVCQMIVNNQFGTIYDMERLCILMKKKCPNALLHIDAVQGIGKIDFNIRRYSIYVQTSISVSGHKINGPKGVGLLLYDNLVGGNNNNVIIPIQPIVYGGGQENGFRSGTENVIGIMALRKSIEVCVYEIDKSRRLFESLYKTFVRELESQKVKKVFVVTEKMTSFAILSVVIPNVPAEVVFNHLSKRNVYCSVGSACQTRDNKLSPSIVNRLGKEVAKNVLRFSFSRFTTIGEVKTGVKIFLEIVNELTDKHQKDSQVMDDEEEEEKVEEEIIIQKKKIPTDDDDVKMSEKKTEKRKRKRILIDDSGDKFFRILCRVGELALKKKNRNLFEKQLYRNIKAVCNEICACTVEKRDRRVYVTPTNESDRVFIQQIAQRLTKVYGLQNISLCLKVKSDIDSIINMCVKICEKKLKESTGVIPFRITAKRANKGFRYPSIQVQRMVGEKIVELDPYRYTVNLKNPQFEVCVDIRSGGTYIFNDKIQCAGGFPVGTTGRGLTLLSGGFDSPVASCLLMKRGMTVNFVSFFSFPYTSQKYIDKIKKIIEVLAVYQQTKSKIYFIPFTKIQEAIRDKAPEKYRTVLYRRAMNHIALKVAKKVNAKCLITGESLGQVASQTIQNITSIREPVGHFPILRPLIGMDKSEIIAIAKRIGTYETSNIREPDTCTLFAPKNPIIYSKLKDSKEAESKVENLNELFEEALNNALVYNVKTNMFKEEIKEDKMIIDKDNNNQKEESPKEESMKNEEKPEEPSKKKRKIN